jgi:hypothetical protein
MHEAEIGRSQCKAGPGKKCETLSEKTTIAERFREWLKWYSILPSKHKALSSNPNPAKNKIHVGVTDGCRRESK